MPDEPRPNAAEPCDTPDRHGLLALSLYLAISALFFGRPLLGHFRDTYLGTGRDPSIALWCLVWWPHALVHRLSPFLTKFIFTPDGANLAWTTSVPLLSFVAWPLTASLGPIAAFNVLCLVSLPLDAWSAFLLCRHICRAWWPSLLGGYIFGFSAYMLSLQSCGRGALSQTMVFLIPLAVLLILRAIASELASGRLLAALTALLVAQFLISIEVFATMTAVGGMGLFLGCWFAPSDTGKRILKTLPGIVGAYAAAVVILGPYIYYLFAFGSPQGQIWSLDACSSDLLNFILPTQTNALGAIPLVERLAAPFSDNGGAESAYMGLPLIFLAAAYAWRHWREPTGKLLIDSLIITCVLALGPLLHFRGVVIGEGPGKLLAMMPELDKALPARYMMYSFLLLAIIASLWFVENQFSSAIKVALAATVVVSTLPNLSGSYWTRPDDSPEFFTTALHRQYLAPGQNVLILPFGVRGNSMLWQAQTGMYFRMAGGYWPTPPEFREWPIVEAFFNVGYLPDAGAQLTAFMAHHAVDTVVVVDNDPDAQAWHKLASACCARSQSAGGVTLYKAAPSALEPYAPVSALDMSRRADSALIDTLVLAADRYLSNGNNLASLTPLEAQRRGLLPGSWLTGPTAAVTSELYHVVTDPSGRSRFGIWLGPMADRDVSVGIYGSYAALEPIIDRYRHSAVRIYFPYPQSLAATGADAGLADTYGLMVAEFEREQLSAAAAQVRASASTHRATTGAPAFAGLGSASSIHR